jgi:hypothetical protein
MPRFTPYTREPEPGVYMAQVIRASNAVSKSGNPMIALTLSTIPCGAYLWHYLVFNGSRPAGRAILQFCRCCEGELLLPEELGSVSLTADDVMHRIVYVDVVREVRSGWEPRLVIKYGGVLPRAQALARNPGLANIPPPPIRPPARKLAAMPTRDL